ncbi:MAG: metalloregulator ArsR/SmtB family transcription factor, partial [Chloroflexota bacterium]|nr:metalloregulator ArsR/SmtB family transcription factor [Chloroflexota bacterium]
MDEDTTAISVTPTDQPPTEAPAKRVALLLDALKGLADLSRLRILGALATQERTVEELADLLELKAPTVSHHLARLRALGLVETRAAGVTRWNRLRADGLERIAKMLATPDVVLTLAADAENTTGERKLVRGFLDGERLREIPAQRKRREAIMRWLVEDFAWERVYSEAEVNAILARRHPDVAYLRRELVGQRLMARERGRYWRTEELTDDLLRRAEQRLAWGRIYTQDELDALIHHEARDEEAVRRE